MSMSPTVIYTKRPAPIGKYFKDGKIIIDNWRDYLLCLSHDDFSLPETFDVSDMYVRIGYSHEVSTGEGRYNAIITITYNSNGKRITSKIFSSRFPTYDDAVKGCEQYIHIHYYKELTQFLF